MADTAFHGLPVAHPSGREGNPLTKRGRRPLLSDEQLVAAIRELFSTAPEARFCGEGYRKVGARLRRRGIRAEKERIRRLMGEHELLAPIRTGKPRGPRIHDGTIIPMALNVMWGTDATASWTTRHGQVTVIATTDHFHR